MKSVIRFLMSACVALATLASCHPVAAQQLKIATGGAKLTYSTMFKELQANCGSSVSMVEQNTDGSMTNVDLLIGNQINGAFVQTDVLFYRSRTEDLGNVKTLLALHPEEVHIVTKNASRKEGGVMGIGGSTVTLNSILDLSGRTVGAAGGAFITAQVIRLQSEIPMQVSQFADNDTLMKALASGGVDAAIIVGGSPIPLVNNLTSEYKLLQIPEAVQAKLKAVYRPARLNYSRMGAAGVQSVATDALFVTREYKTPKMIQGLTKFRACAMEAIPELKETLGTHPKWQAIDTSSRGKWPWYELK